MTTRDYYRWIKTCLECRPYSRLGYCPCILIVDNFGPHKDAEIAGQLKIDYGCTVILVPNGCTSKFQPLNVLVMKSFKHELNRMYNRWCTKKNVQQDEEWPEPTKEEISKWIHCAWEAVNPELIKKSFSKAHVCDHDEEYLQKMKDAPTNEELFDYILLPKDEYNKFANGEDADKFLLLLERKHNYEGDGDDDSEVSPAYIDSNENSEAEHPTPAVAKKSTAAASSKKKAPAKKTATSKKKAAAQQKKEAADARKKQRADQRRKKDALKKKQAQKELSQKLKQKKIVDPTSRTVPSLFGKAAANPAVNVAQPRRVTLSPGSPISIASDSDCTSLEGSPALVLPSDLLGKRITRNTQERIDAEEDKDLQLALEVSIQEAEANEAAPKSTRKVARGTRKSPRKNKAQRTPGEVCAVTGGCSFPAIPKLHRCNWGGCRKQLHHLCFDAYLNESGLKQQFMGCCNSEMEVFCGKHITDALSPGKKG